jgi:hypothetical protein
VNAQSTAYTINSTGKKKLFLKRTDAGGEEGAHPAVPCWGVGRQCKVILVAGGGRRSRTSLPAASWGSGRGSRRLQVPMNAGNRRSHVV